MVLTVIIFLLSMSFCVIIHEAGHYLAAKLIGVYTYEFSLGFGPRLFFFKPLETEFSLRVLPLGGYVAAAGEADDDGERGVQVPFERTLPAKSPWKRLVFFLAGVVNNVILALVLITLVTWFQGTADTTRAVVGEVMEGLPAATAGLQPGDKILAVDGTELTDWTSLLAALARGQGRVDLTIERNGEVSHVDMPFVRRDGRNVVGITAPVIKPGLGGAIVAGWHVLWSTTAALYGALWNLVRHPNLSGLGGPVAIAHTMGQAARAGLWAFISYLALLSLNLGVFNLLPLPALDGSHALLAVVEGVTGKKMPEKAERWLHLTGFALLLLLFVVITGHDILALKGAS